MLLRLVASLSPLLKKPFFTVGDKQSQQLWELSFYYLAACPTDLCFVDSFLNLNPLVRFFPKT